ncbi:MAG TPA: hypothetical protein VFQ48_00195 [Pseudonocardiaceae bacterium]|nr:hypothetical protein [Pseudonocardiaceae bacterium]
MKLDSEVIEWLALHRTHEGGLTKLGMSYLNCGRPIGGYLAEMLDELIHTRLLALGPPSPTGQQQVRVTHTGQARYTTLCSGLTPARTADVPDGH